MYKLFLRESAILSTRFQVLVKLHIKTLRILLCEYIKCCVRGEIIFVDADFILDTSKDTQNKFKAKSIEILGKLLVEMRGIEPLIYSILKVSH